MTKVIEIKFYIMMSQKKYYEQNIFNEHEAPPFTYIFDLILDLTFL